MAIYSNFRARSLPSEVGKFSAQMVKDIAGCTNTMCGVNSQRFSRITDSKSSSLNLSNSNAWRITEPKSGSTKSRMIPVTGAAFALLYLQVLLLYSADIVTPVLASLNVDPYAVEREIKGTRDQIYVDVKFVTSRTFLREKFDNF